MMPTIPEANVERLQPRLLAICPHSIRQRRICRASHAGTRWGWRCSPPPCVARPSGRAGDHVIITLRAQQPAAGEVSGARAARVAVSQAPFLADKLRLVCWPRLYIPSAPSTPSLPRSRLPSCAPGGQPAGHCRGAGLAYSPASCTHALRGPGWTWSAAHHTGTRRQRSVVCRLGFRRRPVRRVGRRPWSRRRCN